MTIDNDIPQCAFLIQQGSEEPRTIKAVIDSKLRGQAEDEDVQVLSPTKPSNPTEPIASDTPSPTTTKPTWSDKRRLSYNSLDNKVPEIDNEKLEDITNRFHNQIMIQLTEISTDIPDIFLQSIAQNILAKCLTKSSDGTIKLI